ncbi:MAG: DUF2877 domain-containing protein [Enterocloster asparagiformis]|nr:DUF2877 domain-containing protein [Enterocloster asparagiformis]
MVEPENAGRISSYLEGALDGRSAGAVHSCFQTSFNFTLGERLIHAGPPSRPLCCFGMELPEAWIRDMLAGIAPGDLACCRDGRIVLYGRHGIFTIHTDLMEIVDLQAETIFDTKPRAEYRPAAIRDSALWQLLENQDLEDCLGIRRDARFEACCRILEEYAFRGTAAECAAGGGQDAVDEHTARDGQSVAVKHDARDDRDATDEHDAEGRWDAADEHDAEDRQGAAAKHSADGGQSAADEHSARYRRDSSALKKAVSWLIGRGRGLTPSGDDILLGYGAGLLALDPSGAGQRFLDILESCLHGQTTDISLAYCKGLVAGYVNENMKLLLRGFWNNDRENTGRWLASVRELGHTSGCDTLFGLGLAAAGRIKNEKWRGKRYESSL